MSKACVSAAVLPVLPSPHGMRAGCVLPTQLRAGERQGPEALNRILAVDEHPSKATHGSGGSLFTPSLCPLAHRFGKALRAAGRAELTPASWRRSTITSS